MIGGPPGYGPVGADSADTLPRVTSTDRILELFDFMVGEVVDALEDLEDWGLSGQRATQYNHDVVADDLIIGRLLAEGFSVLSEESGVSGDGDITVVVDPVDGSTNGSRALPWYATSLCAVDADGPLVSTVVNLATGDWFRAVRGEGAEADTIDVVPSGCSDLSDALLAFSGLPAEHGGWRQFRVYGAAALDLCGVACGQFDGYADLNRAHGVWDYLGAWLVCREAGVAMADSGGEDLVVLDPNARRGPVAAASEELLAEMLEMMRGWPTA